MTKTLPQSMCPFLVVLSLLCVSAFSAVGQTAAGEDAGDAESLHQIAVKAYGENDFKVAITLWNQAEKLEPNWKYALNLANAYSYTKEWKQAVEACVRAKDYGTPDGHVSTLREILAEASKQMGGAFTFLRIHVAPADATLTRNGVLLQAPYELWVSNESSTMIEASAPHHRGHKLQVLSGNMLIRDLDIALTHDSEFGSIHIVGKPIGAEVRLDGQSVGTLPEYRRDYILPKTIPIEVTNPGYIPFSQECEVEADTVNSFKISLKRIPEEDADMAIGPIILLSSGAAIVATGGVFTYLTAISHAEQGNIDGNLSPEAQMQKYEQLDEEREMYQALSLSFYAIGGAAMLGGIAWSFFGGDDSMDEPPRSDDSPAIPSIYIFPLQDGGFAGTHWRF